MSYWSIKKYKIGCMNFLTDTKLLDVLKIKKNSLTNFWFESSTKLISILMFFYANFY